MDTVLIVVDYEEFKPETYKGCYLFDEGKKLFQSYTGIFEADYQAVCLAGDSLSVARAKQWFAVVA